MIAWIAADRGIASRSIASGGGMLGPFPSPAGRRGQLEPIHPASA